MADINRAQAEALINQQNSAEIFQQAVEYSAALRTFRQVPMGAKQHRMPVIDALPTAAFVTGDNGIKPTANQIWVNKMLEAEEVAVIVPIPENVFDDAAFNVWDQVRPRIAESVGAAIDRACFFGVGKPASWPAGIETQARTFGNIRSAAAAGDLAEDINQTMALVEADGFDPTTVYARRSMRAALVGLRSTQGEPIYSASLKADGGAPAVYGVNIDYVRNGSWRDAIVGPPPAGATAIVGDASMAILGIRQDMTFKILTEATLTNGSGVVLFSLAETDMIALRCKMRVAFQIADPTTIEGGTAAFPFAILDL